MALPYTNALKHKNSEAVEMALINIIDKSLLNEYDNDINFLYQRLSQKLNVHWHYDSCFDQIHKALDDYINQGIKIEVPICR